MDFRDLQYFVTVVEEASFSKAARKLHVSQPPLSQCVLRLEEKFGVQLLHRGRGDVTLTYAGERFQEFARQILSLNNGVHESMAEIAALRKGRLCIGVSQFKSKAFLAQVLPLLRDEYPDLQIVIVEEDSLDLERLVLSGKVDLGIISLPLSVPGFTATPILSERILLALPVNHPLTGRFEYPEGKDLPEVAVVHIDPTEPFLMLIRGLRLRRITEEFFAAYNFRPPVAYESRNVETLLSMVAAGMGLALVPECARVASGKGGHCAYATLKGHELSRTLAIIRNGAKEPSEALAGFIAFLQGCFA
ncbi:LysR family transcriptional regulator [Desulfovibrio sp. OttesenSCG-928-O18]|nr:LysR family transcriptional regulator [Desulfovibrio sp. OttesenSCG-928-O18]